MEYSYRSQSKLAKNQVTDAEDLIATTSRCEKLRAENDVKVAQAYVTHRRK